MEGILKSFRRLDWVLEQAVGSDLYCKLCASPDEVGRSFTRDPGMPLLWREDGGAGKAPAGEGPVGTGSPDPRFEWLKDAFDLTDFDMDVIVLALAPEIDTYYERIFAYLRDQVVFRQVDVALALSLLCSDPEEKSVGRTRFAPDAPLLRNRLIYLAQGYDQSRKSLLSSLISLDEQIINLLLYQKGLDSRLVAFCTLSETEGGLDDLSLSVELKRALRTLALQARNNGQPLRFYFHGPRGAGKKEAAAALAHETGAPLLLADLSLMEAGKDDAKKSLETLFREAWFKDALLCCAEADVLFEDELSAGNMALYKILAEHSGITILTGSKPLPSHGLDVAGIITVPFTSLDYSQRRDCWRHSLKSENFCLEEESLDILAGRFKLTRGQIASAVIFAGQRARWNAAGSADEESAADLQTQPVLKDFYIGVRAQTGRELASLTVKIDSADTWDDLVLPADAKAQLRELAQRVIYRDRVMDEWGFNRKLSHGKGVNALFSGPSGTGKTMAAGVVANELELDLYKIDLSSVVSKYIGETEKNLERIFSAAENTNSILFFDEADAIFGKRSEVRDAHDRYANIEISYLLQKMEQYEGFTILATNLRQNLDDAFLRRIADIIHFPFPNEEDRRRIWEGVWPKAAPLAEDVDLNYLARRFKLSGGNIKNISLAASFLAAAGDEITMGHILGATRREYQKMGKTLSEDEFYG